MKQQRQIIKIDRDKCNGCGQCVTACHEGALALKAGKAEIIADHFCDGLGACIGECPQGALTFETRAAAAFDEVAVKQHLETGVQISPCCQAAKLSKAPEKLACGCPGTLAKKLDKAKIADNCGGSEQPSRLENWPVQLQLIPVNAPYLNDASLVLAAQCAGFADPNFHANFLGENVVLAIACPKLDDADQHIGKLAELIAANNLRSITVVRMEVPCCAGLERIVTAAVAMAQKPVFVKTVVIKI
ncbi:MAG: 4Fe-4S binding protein [Negativicutes bacterium]|jgi:ferredoxin